VVAEWGNGEIRDRREVRRERDVWEGSWGERSGWGGVEGAGGRESWHLDRKGNRRMGLRLQGFCMCAGVRGVVHQLERFRGRNHGEIFYIGFQGDADNK